MLSLWRGLSLCVSGFARRREKKVKRKLRRRPKEGREKAICSGKTNNIIDLQYNSPLVNGIPFGTMTGCKRVCGFAATYTKVLRNDCAVYHFASKKLKKMPFFFFI